MDNKLAIDALKAEAKALKIKGYGLMRPETLAERIAEIKDEDDQVMKPVDRPTEAQKATVKTPTAKEVPLYPFTDHRTGRIGLWHKHDPKSEVRPGDKKFASAYSFVRWV